jgi:hypothetical protein
MARKKPTQVIGSGGPATISKWEAHTSGRASFEVTEWKALVKAGRSVDAPDFIEVHCIPPGAMTWRELSQDWYDQHSGAFYIVEEGGRIVFDSRPYQNIDMDAWLRERADRKAKYESSLEAQAKALEEARTKLARFDDVPPPVMVSSGESSRLGAVAEAKADAAA